MNYVPAAIMKGEFLVCDGPTYRTPLYDRIHAALCDVAAIDTHEHLPRPGQVPAPEDIGLGWLLTQGVSWDLASAGMPRVDLARALDDKGGLTPDAQWALIAPWVERVKYSGYWETVAISMRDLYGVEELSATAIPGLVEAVRAAAKPGLTRRVFDKAGIDFALNNPFPMGPELLYRHCDELDCFMVDMHDPFAEFPTAGLARDTGADVTCLNGYLDAMDVMFDRYGRFASAYKIPHAYWRTLEYDSVTRDEVEPLYDRLVSEGKAALAPAERKALEDFITHVVCEKCAEYGLRVKVHCGLQAYNQAMIPHSRAALMNQLFLDHPDTQFDIYHISFPYWEEAGAFVKMFPTVTINFCWAWSLNPAASRLALSHLLDMVPLNKIHGFGGDYSYAEGAYGAAVIARREIGRVLCEKVEEGRFTEEQAVGIGRMLLRDNALANFDLAQRRQALQAWVASTGDGG